MTMPCQGEGKEVKEKRREEGKKGGRKEGKSAKKWCCRGRNLGVPGVSL